jgi:primosomal protein N' (replication factor Y) (superfamily II helicase)
MFAEVIFPNISDKPYTYNIPSDYLNIIKIGMRVLAPTGNRNSIGFVINLPGKSEFKNLKYITEILDPEPVFTEDLWQLTKWISEYYYTDWGITLRTCFPKESRLKTKKIIKFNENLGLNEAIQKIGIKTKNKMSILQEIYLKKEIPLEMLKKQTAIKNINPIISEFENLNITSSYSKLIGGKIKYEKIIYLNERLKDRAILEKTLDELEKKSKKQFEVLLFLFSGSNFINNPRKYTQLLKERKATHPVIKSLAEKELIFIDWQELLRISNLDYTEAKQDIVLNKHQSAAVKEIEAGIDSQKYSPYLLFGITGSGKTQVYIEAIKSALEKGKDAIVLVPEISLTPQLTHRFQRHFGDKVTIIHSKMSAGERYDSWRMIIEGKYKIVIGARSAIFAPLKNLGIIVVDEEHEPSYKQFDMNPRYNARDTAIMRAIFSKSAIVLGSATPSIESFNNAKLGKYKLLELPERIDNARLPDIQIVDMIKEIRSGRTRGSISHILKEKIADRIKKKEGVILLQNHRGFSTYAKCLDCGYVETCENCNVTLTYHKGKNHLRCHYCGFVKKVSTVCPKCYSSEFKYGGVGTQKVEEELMDLFPNANILRMDLDTTAKKGAHTDILKKFGDGSADILLGTQMVAKGLDFSRVTLVGVILADTGMHFPDFRANERTFQLLTQVAGRAGRSNLSGEVLIQTFLPDHYCFDFVKKQDYVDFYEHELTERKQLLYPPFGRIILIEFKGENETEVLNHAIKFNNQFNIYSGYLLKKTGFKFCTILGPTSAVISKIKNQFRIQLIIKADRKNDPAQKWTREALNSTISAYEKKIKSPNVKYFIDVDPMGML